MFYDSSITGKKLPLGVLCLTYDDGPGTTAGAGPGPRTMEIAGFLAELRLPATFFVIGRHAQEQPATLAAVSGMGHLLANHTYSHPDLVALEREQGDPVEELVKTDAIIAPHVPQGAFFFRPPFGSWKAAGAAGSSVAQRLNQSRCLRHYVGPILWDIDGRDWQYWKWNRPAEECVQEYLRQIAIRCRGIVLLHDSSAEEEIRVRQRTLELTRLLVPRLIQAGYRFVRLDAVPQVMEAQQQSAHADTKT